MNLKIFRFEKGKDEKPRYDIFPIRETSGITVLGALFQIQDELDGSLSFRYSCRGAVCGSCAMLINKRPRLACRTQIKNIKKERVLDLQGYGALAKPIYLKEKDEILVEPLPNFPVIKDLIVDMTTFFEHYRSIKPYLYPSYSDMENLMSPKDERKIEIYTNCILCAICIGACPVSSRNKDFLGPAILAKAWRFIADPRYTKKKEGELLEKVNSQQGVWGCDTVYKCTDVCPKQVPPTQAITALRRKLFVHKLKKIIRRP